MKNCVKCGHQIGNAKFCPKCGEVSPASNMPSNPLAGILNGDNSKYILAGGAALILIIIISVAVSMNSGYKSVVKTVVSAFQKEDPDKLEGILSESFKEFVEDSRYFDDVEEFCEEMIDEMIDAAKSSVGNIKSIKYKIDDVNELSSRKVEQYIEKFDDLGVDASDITKVLIVDVEIEFIGSKDDESEDVEFYIVKEKGKWKLSFEL